MNRSSSGSSSLSLSKSLVGFLNAKAAEGLSDGTLANYEFRLKQWIDSAFSSLKLHVMSGGLLRWMAVSQR